ncbi:MAG: hypothetical protein JW909_07990 [Planctomycetes bacterium]|nr:hypothetical protein [Planctomycetota bacterium]
MDAKKMGIMAGCGAALFLVGLLIGYFAFNDNALVDKLKQDLKDQKTAADQQIAKLQEEKAASAKAGEEELKKLKEAAGTKQKEDAERIEKLTKDLDNTQFALGEEKTRSEEQIASLKKELASVSRNVASGPQIPKLVNNLTKAWPSWLSLALAATDLANEVEASTYRPPVKESLDEKVAALGKAAEEYAPTSAAVYEHVQSRRGELRTAGFDCAALEKLFDPRNRQLAERLQKEVIVFQDGVTSEIVEVDATKDFQDTRTKVAKSDFIFLEVTGSKKSKWQMSQEWGERGVEGWEDVPGHLKVVPELAGGALIMRIGVSKTYMPGYGDMPAVATDTGRIFLGINDKKLDDNLGSITVRLIKVSAEAVSRFDEFWKTAAAGLK